MKKYAMFLCSTLIMTFMTPPVYTMDIEWDDNPLPLSPRRITDVQVTCETFNACPVFEITLSTHKHSLLYFYDFESCSAYEGMIDFFRLLVEGDVRKQFSDLGASNHDGLIKIYNDYIIKNNPPKLNYAYDT